MTQCQIPTFARTGEGGGGGGGGGGGNRMSLISALVVSLKTLF